MKKAADVNMKIITPIYRIIKCLVAENTYTAWLAFNPEHPLYQGHFPGKPVTPGACLLQTVEELVSLFMEKPCYLTGAKQLKFLHMHHPNTPLRFEISLDRSSVPCSVKVQIYDEQLVISKMIVSISL